MCDEYDEGGMYLQRRYRAIYSIASDLVKLIIGQMCNVHKLVDLILSQKKVITC